MKMTSDAELRINLASLKRQDPYIAKITDSSTHVAVYSFSPQSSEWEKTDVEGALFVYKRVAPPHWGFTILNRLSMENLTEPLTSQLEFQTQNPFLLYRNARLLIYGIWFYDQEDCQRIGELLEKLCRESSHSVSNDVSLRKINIFDITETNNEVKESAPKSTSPTSNSVNSISPGSSVGGVQRIQSNGEADSESDDKEVAQSNKGSVDIMDLLCKAQNKYEKEKRNTPDPTMDLQNGTIVSPSESELPIVKPLAVKPAHPQKLDVATLFKQQPPKPPDATVATNGQSTLVPMLATVPTMAGPPYVVIPQQMAKLPQPSGKVNIPQPNRRSAVGRSFSMSDMGMRQSLDTYMNTNVMSVEEVEANINRATVVNRQQQLTLDRMIDEINSGGSLRIPGSTMTQITQLPGIQEVAAQNFVQTSTGNSGGMVVNGNKTFFSGSDTFSGQIKSQMFSGVAAHVPVQAFQLPNQRQRSISTSGVQPPRLGHVVVGPANQQPPANFPVLSNASALSNQVVIQTKSLPVSMNVNPVVPTAVPPQIESSLLLHGKALVPEKSPFTNPIVTAISTAVSTITVTNQLPKVPLTTTIMPNASKSCPAMPTTLISPEDFEQSAKTPQKKMELKQRLLQQNVQPVPKENNTVQTPLNKEQLQLTLVSLLQKDSSFLDTIHEAYLSNFTNNQV